MIIRKKYRVEMGHIVRNCSSRRCSYSQHGHSAIIEVLLEGDKLDNAGMLYDFGLMKDTIKQFIDLFDHCYVFWKNDDPEFIDYIKKYNERWIALPFNPTAEMLSLMFMNAINMILTHTEKLNGEGDIKCIGVIYHETESGYAQCSLADNATMWDPKNLYHMVFSNELGIDIGYNDLKTIWDGRTITPIQKPVNQVHANPCGFKK